MIGLNSSLGEGGSGDVTSDGRGNCFYKNVPIDNLI